MKDYYYEEITVPKILHNQKICYEPHFHNEVEIILMYEGSATVFLNENQYTFSTGECLIVFPNVIHSYITSENVDVGKFIFSLNKESSLYKILNAKLPVNPILCKNVVSALGIGTLSKKIIANYSLYSELLKESYLALLTAEILEKTELIDKKRTANDSSFLSVLNYCELHFKENLTLKVLSEELHISKSHLSHIFCNKLKMNFRQYLNIMRINEAKILLKQTNYSVTEISENVGFGSLRSFDKSFYSLVGVSPREYRRKE